MTDGGAWELTMKVRLLWGFGMYIMCDYDKLPIRYIVRMCVPSLMLYDPGANSLNIWYAWRMVIAGKVWNTY